MQVLANGFKYLFPDHIFEKLNPEMEKLGFECKCLGGGKIDHNSKDKKLRVFGLSTVSPGFVSLNKLQFMFLCKIICSSKLLQS